MMKSMTALLKDHKNSILLLYFPLYMIWFRWLENREADRYLTISCSIDSRIPFCELFVIPYFLWFLYVTAVLFVLFRQKENRGDFYRLAAILMMGMTTCLMIYTIFPNVQPLRPETFPRDNIFTRIIAALYQCDTPTNVCPSIHVYNSIAVHVALAKSELFRQTPASVVSSIRVNPNSHPARRTLLCRDRRAMSCKAKKGWKTASLILCILICLSTMFLKQHSVIDVICALALYGTYYIMIYLPAYGRDKASLRQGQQTA